MNALIGYTGFVGSTLLRQFSGFTDLYRSLNIEDIRGREFELVVCAGAPAQKWRANREPQADADGLERLWNAIRTVRCARFVLISTVDVYHHPIAVDENSPIDTASLQPYGLNRRILEMRVRDCFRRSHIVRLPGLVGPGLRKNVLFDLKHHRSLDAVDPRSQMQFYDMDLLWSDLGATLESGMDLVNLAVEPVVVGSIAREVFGVTLADLEGRSAQRYQMETVHAGSFGRSGRYRLSAAESQAAIARYAGGVD